MKKSKAPSAEAYRRFRDKVRKIHAMVWSQNAGEAATAKRLLEELLAKFKKTPNDLQDIIQEPRGDEVLADDEDDDDGDSVADVRTTRDGALQVVYELLSRYVDLSADQYLTMALWCLHTFVFKQFPITPRLALMSPVPGCGKSTVFDLLEKLAARVVKTDSASPAVVVMTIDEERCTFLADEIENWALLSNASGLMRTLIDAGHKRGGNRMLVIGGRRRRFELFAPFAMATLSALPRPVAGRSIIIRMHRMTQPVRRLDTEDPVTKAELDATYRLIFAWGQKVKLNTDPEIPEELQGRTADNWRILLAIADAAGWGIEARAAAVALSGRQDEHPGVAALADIKEIFGTRDRMTSKALVGSLVALEGAQWSE